MAFKCFFSEKVPFDGGLIQFYLNNRKPFDFLPLFDERYFRWYYFWI